MFVKATFHTRTNFIVRAEKRRAFNLSDRILGVQISRMTAIDSSSVNQIISNLVKFPNSPRVVHWRHLNGGLQLLALIFDSNACFKLC
jgi:hypothetical protein